ncbi:MAG: orotidine 5'-phosphate decarboxylase [Candidatus Altiarchaeales archaeon A3]|nr:MAG: orotidine 5'-phosphate decarboxylase [Candidatus Altiarchaeales archaeon A3]
MIFNLDVEKGIEILDKIYPYLAACKINRTLTDIIGMNEIKRIIEQYPDLPFIADFKIADIPHTNDVLSKNAGHVGFDAITVQAFVGSDAVMAVQKNLDVILVVAMSHEGAKEFISENTKKFCELALNLNIDAVVAPATRTEEIKTVKEILKSQAIILSPGVGVQGGNFGDAVRNGSDFEMIGRTIYDVKNPKEIANEIYEKLPFKK